MPPAEWVAFAIFIDREGTSLSLLKCINSAVPSRVTEEFRSPTCVTIGAQHAAA
jgi:hypothetical protein